MLTMANECGIPFHQQPHQSHRPRELTSARGTSDERDVESRRSQRHQWTYLCSFPFVS